MRTIRHGHLGRLGGLAIAVVLATTLVAACSSSKKASTKATTSTSTTTTTASGGADASGASSDSASSGATSVWTQTAAARRGQNGKTFTLACTPKGTASTVWGAGTYTDDSSICTAAVQSGLITFAKGGTVTYQIAPGQNSYDGGVANGVTSKSYGSWSGSFTFPDAPPGTVTVAAGPESWSVNATDHRGKDGTRVTVRCSANGTLGGVWGSGPYTDDSSVCSAAVHAGLITVAKGGTVVIEIAPGRESYQGSTAHGVTSSDYGSFQGSFTFPSDQSTSS